ncbi:hypothetical protein GDO81_029435 [Engystomops pustulosus]|uniref:Transmembrane protein n=1 Tax=Engystomops pustulosus TaxID=76066 RepID=A0AAV6YCQ2_ENGPU|nr:hypothetical protein GDO81_029435 [Engystomops pustulosus]
MRRFFGTSEIVCVVTSRIGGGRKPRGEKNEEKKKNWIFFGGCGRRFFLFLVAVLFIGRRGPLRLGSLVYGYD